MQVLAGDTVIVLIVQWIRRDATNVEMEVRFLLGTPPFNIMKHYTVHFNYIDTGKSGTEKLTVNDTDSDAHLPIDDIVKLRWGGLLSSSLGLRKVTGIVEEKDDV